MNIAKRIRSAFALSTQQEREHEFLSRSVSLADLERRQRELDNGRFRRGNFPF